ncbi:nuclease [Brenneria goodwinii]|uniref:Nuclease n=2 Tax=Brenneria goodwinii TaxID=1109412 RepID=A0AAE8EPM9_9GAMM|nr:nuclease [Brenneria goodwinii]RLM26756.1 nuclease [Brenneria goodwinii]
MKKAAIMIDAGFFMQRVHATQRKHFKDHELSATHIMKIIWALVQSHLNGRKQSQDKREPVELYRIYFYDCPPLDIQTRLPLPSDPSHKTPGRKNFKLEPSYILREALHEELRKSRKTALRLGTLVDNKRWQLKTHALDALMTGRRKWDELNNDDFYYDIKQKQVDIKLGMDITTLAYEKLVDVIVLVAGDSDFVPAAKHARIKGIDFILDPLRQTVTASLSEHIDGVHSYSLISGMADALEVEPTPLPDWWHERKPKKQTARPPRHKNTRAQNHR